MYERGRCTNKDARPRRARITYTENRKPASAQASRRWSAVVSPKGARRRTSPRRTSTLGVQRGRVRHFAASRATLKRSTSSGEPGATTCPRGSIETHFGRGRTLVARVRGGRIGDAATRPRPSFSTPDSELRDRSRTTGADRRRDVVQTFRGGPPRAGTAPRRHPPKAVRTDTQAPARARERRHPSP